MRLFATNTTTDKRFVNAHVSIGSLTETLQFLAVVSARGVVRDEKLHVARYFGEKVFIF